MGKCIICGKENSKAILFMPSNVFVFLCDMHAAKRINSDSSVPIKEWTKKQKTDYKCFEHFMKILEQQHHA